MSNRSAHNEMNPTNDLRIQRARPLISPAVLEEEIPMPNTSTTMISKARRKIADIIHGRDERLLMIVGPCSVHDPQAVKEYGARLKALSDEVNERLLLVLRVYFEKPRTTIGWKGYINDPRLDESFQVNEGLRGARRLLAELAATELPCASEFLDTTLGQYYADLVSWGAIGARTVESQIHRQLASGLSMPVGLKNRTDGDVQAAVDALVAARRAHLFPSLTKEGAPALLETLGNEDSHLVLRGGIQPNYESQSIEAALGLLTKSRIDTGIVIDCSHGNSRKDYRAQVSVARDAIAQRHSGTRKIVGIMLESHLVAGRQDAPATYGQSITDACLGWDETERLIREIARQHKAT